MANMKGDSLEKRGGDDAQEGAQEKGVVPPQAERASLDIRGKLTSSLQPQTRLVNKTRFRFDPTGNERLSGNAELLSALAEQYDAAMKVWTKTFPIDTAGISSQDRVERWLDSLSEQTLDGIWEFKDKATLVFVPPMSVPALMRLIDAHKVIPGQQEGYLEVRGHFGKGDWETIGSTKWKMGITNGGRNAFNPIILPSERDALNPEYASIPDEADHHLRKKGLSLMPVYAYLPLVARALAAGQVLDDGHVTIFKGPNERIVGFGAYWQECRRVAMKLIHPHDSPRTYDTRRPWVEGEGE